MPLRSLQHASSSCSLAPAPSRSCRWFRRAWILHFLCTVIVLLAGTWSNQDSRYDSDRLLDHLGRSFSFPTTYVDLTCTSSPLSFEPHRKYIPIQPDKLGSDCRKAFINVMALSQNEPNAIVCCEDSQIYGLSGLCPQPKVRRLEECLVLTADTTGPVIFSHCALKRT
jgi:hypothetical protein